MHEEAHARANALRARLRGARVVVVGLGASGVAAAKLLRRLGAEVVGTDSAPRQKLSEQAIALEQAGVRLAVGGHADAGFLEAGLVVVSPGVPRLREIAESERRGVEVIGELELATRLLPGIPAIAITGSNGKSTTTTLAHALIVASGKTAFAGGNLGSPPSDLVDAELPLPDVLVLEVSSYQAERMPEFQPRAAALLNASANHLDRYDSFDDYVRAKGNLFVNLTVEDVAVVPADDAAVVAQAKRGAGRVVTFSRADGEGDIVFSRDEIVDRSRDVTFSRREILLSGDHNALNVCAALALVGPFGVSDDVTRRVLRDFRGLPHRIAFVREVGGVRYYDDSKGTNVGASVAAILGLAEPRVVLIAGGRDKLGSYGPLVDALRARGRGLVLLGEAADRIATAAGDTVPIARADSMDEAVERSRDLARPGDAVLLSPACSSFDMFRDYKHRGEAFVQAVERLPR
jgi:UDP-N-acetylmuramoylalanine--D-glutamate ligase